MKLIKRLFDTVKELSNQDISGGMGVDTFNVNIALAQQWLQDFYLQKYVSHRMVEEAMKPFLTSIGVNIVDGLVPFPADYRYLIDMGIFLGVNSEDCKTEPKSNMYPITEMLPGERNMTLSDAIRKPSISNNNFKFDYASTGFNIYPKDVSGSVELQYIITAPEATLAVSYVIADMTEDYDDSNTVDLIWPASELDNLTDIMLLILGVEIRQTELMAWVRNKELLTI